MRGHQVGVAAPPGALGGGCTACMPCLVVYSWASAMTEVVSKAQEAKNLHGYNSMPGSRAVWHLR